MVQSKIHNAIQYHCKEEAMRKSLRALATISRCVSYIRESIIRSFSSKHDLETM